MSSSTESKQLVFEMESDVYKLAFWNSYSEHHGDRNVATFQVYDKIQGFNVCCGHKTGIDVNSIIAHVFKAFVCRALNIQARVGGSWTGHDDFG